MDLEAKFISLTQEGLPIMEFTAWFCQPAQCLFNQSTGLEQIIIALYIYPI